MPNPMREDRNLENPGITFHTPRALVNNMQNATFLLMYESEVNDRWENGDVMRTKQGDTNGLPEPATIWMPQRLKPLRGM